MAKQIYIDENGNELLVSGTINTASILPVSGSDQTSVADKLNNKLDKVDAYGSGTLNWSGDEVLSGDLTVNGSNGITSTKLNGVTIGNSPKFTDTVLVQVYGQENRNFTSSTTLAYTGLSTTCPVGKRMLVRAYFRYVNNAPLQVGAYTSSAGASAYSCMGYADVNTGSFTLNFVITGGETVYYWAKYGGAGANRIDEEKILLG